MVSASTPPTASATRTVSPASGRQRLATQASASARPARCPSDPTACPFAARTLAKLEQCGREVCSLRQPAWRSDDDERPIGLRGPGQTLVQGARDLRGPRARPRRRGGEETAEPALERDRAAG